MFWLLYWWWGSIYDQSKNQPHRALVYFSLQELNFTSDEMKTTCGRRWSLRTLLVKTFSNSRVDFVRIFGRTVCYIVFLSTNNMQLSEKASGISLRETSPLKWMRLKMEFSYSTTGTENNSRVLWHTAALYY